MSVRVLLVDDHPMVRKGLRSLIDGQVDMSVSGEAADGNSALEAACAQVPDVVVMDVSMPGSNGIDATRRIVAKLPDVRVLCFSMHADRHVVSAMLQAGASGYMLKSAATVELLDAVRVVAGGQTYLSPAVAAGVVKSYTTFLCEVENQRGPQLTDRQREVLQLLAEGRSTADIAGLLHVSPKTVATHREHIMEKVGVQSLPALTKYAIRRGITTAQRDPD